MKSRKEQEIKDFYKTRNESNWVKRYQSPYRLRRYYHRTNWEVISSLVSKSPIILDIGCGDGVLSVLMALKNEKQRVIALDISEKDIQIARKAAVIHGVNDRIMCIVADGENLPFKTESISTIVCSHVLEHLPHFDKALQEIHRVLTKNGRAILALPLCLNPSAMVLLGGDNYWCISKKTLFAFWKGLLKVIYAWLKRKEGVNEGYSGQADLLHIRRFPWKAIQRVEQSGLKVTRWMADSLLIPYLGCLIPSFMSLQRFIDNRLRKKSFWRNFGVGIIMEVKK